MVMARGRWRGVRPETTNPSQSAAGPLPRGRLLFVRLLLDWSDDRCPLPASRPTYVSPNGRDGYPLLGSGGTAGRSVVSGAGGDGVV